MRPRVNRRKKVLMAKGPHGGRLLTQDGFEIEITIYERGVPPQFRIYTFEKGKPVDPAEVKLRVQLERLGAQPETVSFRKEKDFLRSEQVIVEPHSFKVSVAAEREGRALPVGLRAVGGARAHGRRHDEKRRHQAGDCRSGEDPLHPATPRRNRVQPGPRGPCRSPARRRRGAIGEKPWRSGEERRAARGAGEPDARRSQERAPRHPDPPRSGPRHRSSGRSACGKRRSPPNRTTSPAARRSPRRRSPIATRSRSCSRWGSPMRPVMRRRLRMSLTATRSARSSTVW